MTNNPQYFRRHHRTTCVRRDLRAFTFIELLVVVGVLAFLVALVLPAMGRTRKDDSITRCINNLRQLGSAWAMYSTDHDGALVASYPNYGGFRDSWVGGNAHSSGTSGSYSYGGADPASITNGRLWSYVKSLTLYKCPADTRVAPAGAPYSGQPILRSVSINSYMAGMSFGVTPSFSMQFPTGAQNPSTPVFLKESEIPRPSSIFVFIDEDDSSINDGTLLVDMGGGGGRLIDCPARRHENAYTISFADAHVEVQAIRDPRVVNWSVTAIPYQTLDWQYLTNVATAPLMK